MRRSARPGPGRCVRRSRTAAGPSGTRSAGRSARRTARAPPAGHPRSGAGSYAPCRASRAPPRRRPWRRSSRGPGTRCRPSPEPAPSPPCRAPPRGAPRAPRLVRSAPPHSGHVAATGSSPGGSGKSSPGGGSDPGCSDRTGGGGTSPFTMAAIVLPTSAAGTTASTASTASTATLAIALAGMPAYVASFGSWTMVAPPLVLITARPAEPSSRVPDSTTPTTRRSSAAAAERKRTSMAGRCPFSSRTDGETNVAVLDHQMVIGGRHQDHSFVEPLAVTSGSAREHAGSAQNPGQHAGAPGCDVQQDANGGLQIGGHLLDHARKCLPRRPPRHQSRPGPGAPRTRSSVGTPSTGESVCSGDGSHQPAGSAHRAASGSSRSHSASARLTARVNPSGFTRGRRPCPQPRARSAAARPCSSSPSAPAQDRRPRRRSAMRRLRRLAP